LTYVGYKIHNVSSLVCESLVLTLVPYLINVVREGL